MNLRVRHEGKFVQLILNGKLILEIPYEQALELAPAIRGCALKAEEWVEAERIAMDGAILLRAGVPLGLSDHPAIKNEVVKLAVSDRSLRRRMPAIKSTALVGAPAILQGNGLIG